MSNLSDTRKAFDVYLKNNFITTEIIWDGTDFEPPKGRLWIRPLLFIDYSTNVNIGAQLGGRFRHYGAYTIYVYSPINSGLGEIYQIVDELIKLFSNKRLDTNILTEAGSVRRIGDGGYGWYQLNVTIPFTADQTAED